jgi:hypothetical protein
MSYLSNTRLIFTGRFQADVSTVNNDVRHFDNASFDKVFQEFQNDESPNGWWNPTGSGAFRLINCRIETVGYADGSTATSSGEDAAIGMLIAGSEGRTSGKLVDIDPQWQLASAPGDSMFVSRTTRNQVSFRGGISHTPFATYGLVGC